MPGGSTGYIHVRGHVRGGSTGYIGGHVRGGGSTGYVWSGMS